MQVLPVLPEGPTVPMPQAGPNQIRIGQLNAHNAFDTADNPSTQDMLLTPAGYAEQMQGVGIIGLAFQHHLVSPCCLCHAARLVLLEGVLQGLIDIELSHPAISIF